MAFFADILGTLRNNFKIKLLTLSSSSLTAARTASFPDKAGTVAYLEDFGSALPTTAPSLFADFANGSIIPSGFNFSRNSTGTHIDKLRKIVLDAANIPRFEEEGLLIEKAATNIRTYSEQFDNAIWTKTRSSISANALTAPDNTLTADKFIEDSTATNTHEVSEVATFTSGVVYTFSIYVKAGERTNISLRTSSVAFPSTRAKFNLSTGVATTEVGTPNAVITDIGKGWNRCSITVTAIATGSGQFTIYLNDGTTVTYTGDGVSGLYIWGVQWQTGSLVTSYIPTVGTAVTQALDLLTSPTTDFATWYRQDAFTIVKDFYGQAVGTCTYFCFHDTTANELYKLESINGALAFTIVDGGVEQCSLSLGTVTTGTFYSVAAAWTLNDIAACVNGGAVVTDTSATLATVTQANWGSNHTNANQMDEHLVRIRGYAARLTNAELIGLTT